MSEAGVMKTVDVGMIRRSVDILSTRATSASTTTSETHPPAYDEWGEDATFNYDSFRNDASGLGFEVTEKYKPLSGTLTEEGNRWTDIRVENPEDNNTFVIVRRLDAVAFAGHPKSTHKSFENPIPQIVFSFNIGSASPIYVNKKGEQFAPVELDPFNTIVDVNWGGEDFVIISIIASANLSCQFDSEITFPKFTGMTVGNAGNGVTYNDCPAMTILCHGSVSHWDDAHMSYKNVAAKEMDPSIPYTYGISAGTTTRNKIYLAYGINPGLNKAYETALNRDYTSLLCIGHWGGKTITNADNTELFGQWGIPYGGAEGQVTDTSTDQYTPHTYWKLKGLMEHIPSQEGQGAGYITKYWFYKQMKTAYILKYDNQPYVYFSFFVGANVLKKALAAAISSQGGGQIEFDVKAGNGNVPDNPDATYVNNGKIRATWYKGSVFKDALTMGSMQIGGSSGQGGGYGHPSTPTPGATFDEAWAAMLDGTGYLPADVVGRLSNAIVTSHEYSFPCGSGLLGAITGRAKFQLDFGGKSADRE